LLTLRGLIGHAEYPFGRIPAEDFCECDAKWEQVSLEVE
jgi:hypothetical protein